MSVEMVMSGIRDIKDFPKEGINFKDITPVLQDKNLLKMSIDLLADKVAPRGADYICGVESRGFIFGTALAYKLGLGFVPIRKPGKLPFEKYSKKYDLEYGSNILEIHKDAFPANSRVVLIDDLLATGGTAMAAAELIELCGSIVADMLFLVELSFLKGRAKLNKYTVDSVIEY